ncbi:MAG: DNA polymerase III subunit delta' [Candidatus Pacebacteria bacterium]|nr:DNA polymerase III subunit delta' [Candidatus Paceibacterota bacterium]
MIVGHKRQWEFLKNAADSNRLPHAVLFSGEQGLGKKKLAVEFVKFLNCENGAGLKPCGVCRSCMDIERNSYPDFTLYEPIDGKEIQISKIRDLILKLSLHSYSNSFKAVIIDQAHLMTKEAQNCFLKTLEEPKGNAVLILITEYPQSLISTILSRVQKIKFFSVNKGEIRDYLVKKGANSSSADSLSSLSCGRPGLALSFLKDKNKLNNYEKFISDIIQISRSDFSFRFQYAKNLIKDKDDNQKENLKEVLEVWLRFFRELLFLNVSSSENDKISFLPDNQKLDMMKNYPLKKIKRLISLIQSTDYLTTATNANPRLAFELLLMEI